MTLPKVIRIDDRLMAGSERFVGVGMNDTNVVPYGTLISEFPGYLGDNNLFPNHPSTKLPATSIEEFWWKYFYLCKLYGWNLIRTSDGWGYDRMRDCLYNDKPWWDRLIGSMLKMAAWNRVYVCFGLGTPGGHPNNNPDWQDAYVVGSAKYNEYVKFCGDVMVQFKDENAIAMFDLANEPNGDGTYDMWYAQNPSNPWAAWEYWAKSFVNAVHARDHSHLTTMGTASGALMHGYDEAAFLSMNSHACDIAHNHLYNDRQEYYECIDEECGFWIDKQAARKIGKPLMIGEYACEIYPNHITLPDGTTASQFYSPWATKAMMDLDIDAMTAMQPVGYPNWPPSQAILDAIPPVPDSDPNPDGESEARVVDAEAYRAMIAMLHR